MEITVSAMARMAAAADHAECEDGWILETNGVRPCPLCRPGRAALFDQGYFRNKRAWSRERIAAVTDEAFRRLGLEPPARRKTA